MSSSESLGKKRNFAIIPAAGKSLRMEGKHKLLLPWRGQTVIETVLDAWQQSSVERIVIVSRSDDHALHEKCARFSKVKLLLPNVALEDMRASITAGLKHILNAWEGGKQNCSWLVAPADLPTLTAEVIERVVEAGDQCQIPVVPWYGAKQGHPVLLPLSWCKKFFEMPPSKGLNSLLSPDVVRRIDLPAHLRPTDVDTPEDYQRLVDLGER